MWTVVYIANSKKSAEHIKTQLEQEGLLVNIKPLGLNNDIESTSFEILVPKGEVSEAHEILDSINLVIKEGNPI